MTARRLRVVAWVAGCFVVALGFWRVETTVNKADTTARGLEREIERDDARSCHISRAVRDETRDLLVQVVTDLGARPRVADTIRDAYDRLPSPPDC